jgi:hypothetical protein
VKVEQCGNPRGGGLIPRRSQAEASRHSLSHSIATLCGIRGSKCEIHLGWHFLNADPGLGMVVGITLVSFQGVLRLRWPQPWQRQNCPPLEALLPVATSPVSCRFNDQALKDCSSLADLLVSTAVRMTGCGDPDPRLDAVAQAVQLGLVISDDVLQALAALRRVCGAAQWQTFDWTRLPVVVELLRAEGTGSQESPLRSPSLLPLLLERKAVVLPSRNLLRMLGHHDAVQTALVREALLQAPSRRAVFYYWAATFMRRVLRSSSENSGRLEAFLRHGGSHLIFRLAACQTALDHCPGMRRCAAPGLFQQPALNLRDELRRACSGTCLRRSLAAAVESVLSEIQHAIDERERLIETAPGRISDQADAALQACIREEFPASAVEAMPLWALAEGGLTTSLEFDLAERWARLPGPPQPTEMALSRAGLLVNELTSAEELALEGAAMAHCLVEPKPFALQCLEGFARVFSIQGSLRATLKLAWSGHGWEVGDFQDDSGLGFFRQDRCTEQWKALTAFIDWAVAEADSATETNNGTAEAISPLMEEVHQAADGRSASTSRTQ